MPAASEREDPGALKLPLYYLLVCVAPEFKKYKQATDTRREESQQAADLVLLRPAWLGDLCILVPGPSCSVLFLGVGGVGRGAAAPSPTKLSHQLHLCYLVSDKHWAQQVGARRGFCRF